MIELCLPAVRRRRLLSRSECLPAFRCVAVTIQPSGYLESCSLGVSRWMENILDDIDRRSVVE